MPLFRHSERSEESIWIRDERFDFEAPAGFFAALGMTNEGRLTL
jgi:hypothetical protein